MKRLMIGLAFAMIALTTAYQISTREALSESATLSSTEHELYSNVQRVFDTRCIACHSCLESPCQLNLQSYNGVARGVRADSITNKARHRPIAPTRLFEDARETNEWRKMGFHDVIGRNGDSVLLESVTKALGDRVRPRVPVRASWVCPSQDERPGDYQARKDLAMPYGMAALESSQVAILADWILAGSPAPRRPDPVAFSPSIRNQVRSWIEFLNGKDLKARITSRYLYEHLFLAHLYFAESPREFLRLIRSSHPCDKPRIISTRTPVQDPGVRDFYYCLVRDLNTLVSKTHLPYELSAKKLLWMRENFLSSRWTPTQFPSYEPAVAANPFLSFREMPIEARYRFLLEDAQYHVMTFIKGPVCNGTGAVNVIQDQFHVFFMDPKADLMVRSPELARYAVESFELPGVHTESVSQLQMPQTHLDLVRQRTKYRELKGKILKDLQPNGLPLEAIWNGDGINSNAVLTVFRHDDNAAVFKGAVGDLSKTVFVLDYITFERLTYNLVVNYDTFGNVGHLLLTRLYMDLIRMDSENNYLDFLPVEARQALKRAWYHGPLTKSKMRLLQEETFPSIPNAIAFKSSEHAHEEMIQKILFTRLSERVRGSPDVMNWKRTLEVQASDPLQAALKRLASVPAAGAPFVNHFSELSFLFITENGRSQRVFSIVRNREHRNVAWIMVEDLRLAPTEDTLTIAESVLGSYPNVFLTVEKTMVNEFVTEVLGIKSKEDYKRVMSRFEVDRLSPDLWRYYDFVNAEFLRQNPVDAGVLDLSRYKL